jgi:hypothetical protein
LEFSASDSNSLQSLLGRAVTLNRLKLCHGGKNGKREIKLELKLKV